MVDAEASANVFHPRPENLLGVKSPLRLLLAALLGLGVYALWQAQESRVLGLSRLVRIQGFLPPYPAAQESTRVEVWFPDEGILYDSMGRPWQRDGWGRLRQRPDPNCRFRALLSPTGTVDVSVLITTWLPPRRCTVRFYTEGAIARMARSLPCQGWRRNLTVQLPTMPLAVPLREAEN